MKLNTLFTINAIVALLFGLGFVLMPDQVLDLYDVTLDDAGTYVANIFGAALLGFATMTWLARNSSASEARNGLMWGLFIEHTVGFVFSLMAQTNEIMNAMGWSIVAIYGLLALGYAYFLFMAPSD
ncbi:MAG: hypothetical protein FVQ83_13645 [Chloroflexi bacterium]|nr:hypothetical protein [Chloroflexota bacterium]